MRLNNNQIKQVRSIIKQVRSDYKKIKSIEIVERDQEKNFVEFWSMKNIDKIDFYDIIDIQLNDKNECIGYLTVNISDFSYKTII